MTDTPTRKLYWDDPHSDEFDARVVAHAERDGRPSVLLEATLFYPEAGGQLPDHGVLDGRSVVDVQVDDAGRIHHVLEGELPAVGTLVSGRLDRARRHEHMALHTGQHMLSRALLELGKAATVSSRLGESGATIDLDRELSPKTLAEIEARVNQVVDEHRVVRQLHPSPEELAAMDLRRAPKVDGAIRIIEVEGFDLTPCGGTHCTDTAQVGWVRITDASRHRGGQRVTFTAGPRTRRVLGAESEALRSLAARFTCGPHDVPAAIDKLERELGEAREQLGATRAAFAKAQAAAISGDPAVASLDTDVATLRALAAEAATGSRLVVLSAAVGDAFHVVATRGPASTVDCGALFRALAERCGGRGGGRPERAEGRMERAPTAADVAAAQG
ncbi:MAG: alanyl-tRNA editing protein [Deltaproteobacteria bacterium]|nr:alanyl-tRNA editing protein [Deltaproteobacteria bacterium]